LVEDVECRNAADGVSETSRQLPLGRRPIIVPRMGFDGLLDTI
jgi:hypothetical protein